MPSRSPWIVLLAEPSVQDRGSVPPCFRPTTDTRAGPEATDKGRLMLVAREQDSPWWKHGFAALPRTQIVEVPVDRGTACGLLVATLRIAGWDPSGYMVATRLGPRDDETHILRRAARQQAEGPSRLHVEDGFVAGPVAALVEAFRVEQPELLLGVSPAPLREVGPRSGVPVPRALGRLVRRVREGARAS